MDRIQVAEKVFPGSSIGVVTINTGTDRIPRRQGVKVILWATAEGQPPHSAEVMAADEDAEDDYYADCGLTWEGNTLDGYDGVAELPFEVLDMLEELGYDVAEMRESLS